MEGQSLLTSGPEWPEVFHATRIKSIHLKITRCHSESELMYVQQNEARVLRIEVSGGRSGQTRMRIL